LAVPPDLIGAAGLPLLSCPGPMSPHLPDRETHSTPEAPYGEVAKGRTLDVLVAGAVLPPNPGELIESHAMEALLERAKSTYDLVVIDTPPLTAVSDAFPLLSRSA